MCQEASKCITYMQVIYMIASFVYNYRNPSLFLFLVLIRAIAIKTPLGIQNLINKEKTKGILVVVVK